MRLDELTQGLFKHALFENISGTDLKIIERDCQPFIHEIGGVNNLIKYPIYRGSNNDFKQMTLKKSNIHGRTPGTTPIETHNYLNQAFTNKFGKPFRNGYFGTGSLQFASNFGTPYQCIPVGEFKYCWSSDVLDLADVLYETNIYVGNKKMNLLYSHEHDAEQTEEKLDEIVSSYQTTNLLDGIKSGNEIMLYSEHFYMVAK